MLKSGKTFLLTILLLSPFAYAEIKTFSNDSMQAIEGRYFGETFVLALWSLECPPCFKDLELLSRWQRENKLTHLVLVSTDSEASRYELAKVLNSYGFSHYEAWVFEKDISIQLRFKIDANWRGELPRSYIYEKDGSRRAHSGILEESDLYASGEE